MSSEQVFIGMERPLALKKTPPIRALQKTQSSETAFNTALVCRIQHELFLAGYFVHNSLPENPANPVSEGDCFHSGHSELNWQCLLNCSLISAYELRLQTGLRIANWIFKLVGITVIFKLEKQIVARQTCWRLKVCTFLLWPFRI